MRLVIIFPSVIWVYYAYQEYSAFLIFFDYGTATGTMFRPLSSVSWGSALPECDSALLVTGECIRQKCSEERSHRRWLLEQFQPRTSADDKQPAKSRALRSSSH
ncbi:hypothetical protein NDU88_001715 [Pleurodeles waltl]|uniref:Secreted protein n=1 Tax=Pleurodeles waltl TaxID=8319 RepID=A0AAV7NDA5_PLEWA|nr:hypothetical protein NDU88_001715 [Pleurodeles waltl]